MNVVPMSGNLPCAPFWRCPPASEVGHRWTGWIFCHLQAQVSGLKSDLLGSSQGQDLTLLPPGIRVNHRGLVPSRAFGGTTPDYLSVLPSSCLSTFQQFWATAMGGHSRGSAKLCDWLTQEHHP